ncbi:Hypothetical protein SSO1725 [Saccharolobus solfataricus P2]|uniref:Putative CRISPR system CMR subunit Cmr7 2 n=1 Tax=Saccharolobus solfataricus (strain ATCC 35092 / DSM 1617 / JCM 11322 / P2) TaxID=273057 RepID=CMR7B_SACS2|nr:hypothetical protein [Saccharolobus solfataricus]Q97XK8.1 RecName: Full=Putative CRISPR system CMR subunit Cmr7 2 [Saccharolobus solfataricus P2]AAK41924.1 Hypothetical protein SSO1725 [Saccharolobus solfataricus P2]
MSSPGGSQQVEWVFIPVIKDVTYEFKVDNNDNITELYVNGNKLGPASSLEMDFYFDVDVSNNQVRKFNNVFVLFGVIATKDSNKIKMQLTLNPCDFVRGFVFPSQDPSQLNNIFASNNKVSVSEKAFAILNRKKEGAVSSTINVYITQNTYTGNTKIEKIQQNTIIIEKNTGIVFKIPNDMLNIFRYSTT